MAMALSSLIRLDKCPTALMLLSATRPSPDLIVDTPWWIDLSSN
jgi:hypothetical protein